MSVTRLVLLLTSCLLVGAASAQVTISSGDIPQTIGYAALNKYLNAQSTTVDNGSPGGPHTWTFDTANFTGDVYTSTVVNKASTPFASRFPDANLVMAEPRGPGFTLYDYFQLNSTSLLVHGYGYYQNGLPKAQVEIPPAVELALPATIGTAWQTAYSIRETLTDTVYAARFAVRCSVDAWGTATTPAGSFACLRENQVEVVIETLYVAGVPLFSDTVPFRMYTWRTPGAGIVAMTGSMYGDTSLSYTEASQYVVRVGTAGVAEAPAAASPRAARGPTVVSGLPRGAAAFDAMGRRALDPRPGIYFLREEPPAAGRAPAVRKVLVTR